MKPLTRNEKLGMVWRATHPDYRGKVDGIRMVLVLDRPTGATVLVPLDGLTDDDLNAKLPAHVRACLKYEDATGWGRVPTNRADDYHGA
jgi:hypothetical protein